MASVARPITALKSQPDRRKKPRREPVARPSRHAVTPPAASAVAREVQYWTRLLNITESEARRLVFETMNNPVDTLSARGPPPPAHRPSLALHTGREPRILCGGKVARSSTHGRQQTPRYWVKLLRDGEDLHHIARKMKRSASSVRASKTKASAVAAAAGRAELKAAGEYSVNPDATRSLLDRLTSRAKGEADGSREIPASGETPASELRQLIEESPGLIKISGSTCCQAVKCHGAWWRYCRAWRDLYRGDRQADGGVARRARLPAD